MKSLVNVFFIFFCFSAISGDNNAKKVEVSFSSFVSTVLKSEDGSQTLTLVESNRGEKYGLINSKSNFLDGMVVRLNAVPCGWSKSIHNIKFIGLELHDFFTINHQDKSYYINLPLSERTRLYINDLESRKVDGEKIVQKYNEQMKSGKDKIIQEYSFEIHQKILLKKALTKFKGFEKNHNKKIAVEFDWKSFGKDYFKKPNNISQFDKYNNNIMNGIISLCRMEDVKDNAKFKKISKIIIKKSKINKVQIRKDSIVFEMNDNIGILGMNFFRDALYNTLQ